MTTSPRTRKLLLLTGFGAGLLIVLALVLWWLKPHAAAPSAAPTPASAPTPSAPPQVRADTQVHGPLPTLAPSLAGTEIDCPLQVDHAGLLVLSNGIRHCFDYFLSTIGEKTESQLISDIRLYLSSTLPATALPYADKLLDQYIAYRHAQTQAGAPPEHLDAASLQAVMQSRHALRLQFFTAPEADAFFGQEDAYDQFTIAQMRINANTNLSAQDKAAQTAAAINQLPAVVADSMRPLLQYQELQQLTKDIKAQGGSAADLHQMRTSLVGEAAAGRLDALDQDDAAWQSQVNSYLAARDQIMASGDAASQQQAIAALRNQTFSTPEDRVRAQAFETMHDQTRQATNGGQ